MRSTWAWDEIRLPAPVFEGDTIYAQSEVVDLRPSRSRPHQGIVSVRTVGFNQEGVVVIEFKRTLLVYRRGHGPAAGTPACAKQWIGGRSAAGQVGRLCSRRQSAKFADHK